MTKAQSKSEGKPRLTNIWKWLDEDFLLEVAEQMRQPVEVMKKYPKDNWKNGKGDEGFIDDRIESAQRHLRTLANSLDKKNARDFETHVHEAAAVTANMMIVFYSLDIKGE